ncbi:MAG TPA: beta/gamma crystallin-related protein [Microlunatus sp.]|nr:beta/gamma crystallin-related protein [Microlunatus sp.]
MRDPWTVPDEQKASGVYLYEHVDYGGRWIRLTQSTPDLRAVGFNDICSSVRIVGPYRATFYEHVDYHGTRSTLATAGSSSDHTGCSDIGRPFQRTSGFYVYAWCPWECGSPAEVANDSISSVFITSTLSYERSSRLVHPAGLWSAAVAGAPSAGWRFFADGTCRFLLITSSSVSEISGRFDLGYHYTSVTASPEQWWSGNYFVLHDGVYKEYRLGMVITEEPLTPDRTFYRYEYAGYDAVRIMQLGQWWQYSYSTTGTSSQGLQAGHEVALAAQDGHLVCAEGGGGRLVANRRELGPWETFDLLDLGNAECALRAHDGHFVCAEGGGGREVVADRTQLGPWETFGVEKLSPISRLALITHDGHFICAEGGGGGEVVADRTQLGPWESFRMLDLGGNSCAFRAHNGQLLCAEGGGGREVVANRDEVGPWETFTLVDLGNARWALRAHNGQLLCAEGGEVVANRTAVGPWESFVIQQLPPVPRVALRAHNGQLLCAEGGGGHEIVANRTAIGSWETFELIETANW